MKILAIGLIAIVTAGCASAPQIGEGLSTGAAAYTVVPAAGEGAATLEDYRLGPLDTIDVAVFQEPDLSVKALQVDASGQIALPLVGSVKAQGMTASELSDALERKLGERYLRNPQVTVTVASSVSQKVSVQGEVAQPGVYQLTGPTTLLDVISLAKGETEVATLDQIVVFRTVNGQRMGAVFDVASIRRGDAPDPVIHGNDLVVVGYSSAKRFWKNIVSSMPLFNVFRPVL
jgi:polysaccharide export outer membrane protein